MLEKSQEDVDVVFSCEPCHYSTNKRSDFNKHQNTAKHKKLTSTTDCNEMSNDNYLCPTCNKSYASRVGLWSHKKKCFPATKENIGSENFTIDTNLIIKLVQQNQHLQNLLTQESKEKSELINKLIEREPNSINSHNNTINNNQKFNLNFFLNETCKDAMNIQEFIDSIRVSFDDLMTIGNTGFVNGLSDIFIKQLRDLDVKKRPIHCTDSKRDTIYLKDQDSWNKDDKDKTKLKQIIERIEYKNVAALHSWCNENPDSKVNNTPNNFLRDKIYLQTLQGDDATREKIIKNISKEVVVDK